MTLEQLVQKYPSEVEAGVHFMVAAGRLLNAQKRLKGYRALAQKIHDELPEAVKDYEEAKAAVELLKAEL